MRISVDGEGLGATFPTRTTDAATAARLRDIVLSLRPAQSTLGCPNENGVRYRLQFMARDRTLDVAVAHSTGCRWLDREGTIWDTTDEFWTALAAAADVPRASLLPGSR